MIMTKAFYKYKDDGPERNIVGRKEKSKIMYISMRKIIFCPVTEKCNVINPTTTTKASFGELLNEI